ncbi:hypothetical protein ACWA7J_02220 [Leptothrix sp. BB-4]
MGINFHEHIFGERQIEKNPNGTQLGTLLVRRYPCWTCYGQETSDNNEKQFCKGCNGKGFFERLVSIESVLSSLGVKIENEEDARVEWASHLPANTKGRHEYEGIRAYVSHEIARSRITALIIDMRGQKASGQVFPRLNQIIQSIQEDFLEPYGIWSNEVRWFHRNSDGGLDILRITDEDGPPRFVPLLEFWDGKDFSGFEGSFSNQLELCIEASVSFADERPY